jgi:rhodanese-related sulfurtransferase
MFFTITIHNDAWKNNNAGPGAAQISKQHPPCTKTGQKLGFGRTNQDCRKTLLVLGFKPMKKILVFAAAFVLAASMYAAEIPTITVGDLKAAIASKQVVLLDANGSDSWQAGHIPGAIDFSANKDNLASVLPKDKDVLVVAYCLNPQCHAYQAAADAAEKLGYKNVKHLTAGIMGWKDAGQKTEPGSVGSKT